MKYFLFLLILFLFPYIVKAEEETPAKLNNDTHYYSFIWPVILRSVKDPALLEKAKSWKFPDHLVPVLPGATKTMVDEYAWNVLVGEEKYDMLAYKSTGMPGIESEWSLDHFPYVIYLKGNKLTLVEGVNILANRNWVDEALDKLYIIDFEFDISDTEPDMSNLKLPGDLKKARKEVLIRIEYLENLKTFPTRKREIDVEDDLRKMLLSVWGKIEKNVQNDELPSIEDSKKLWGSLFPDRPIPYASPKDEFIIKLQPFLSLVANTGGDIFNSFSFYEYGYNNRMVGRSLIHSAGIAEELSDFVQLMRNYLLKSSNFSEKKIQEREKLLIMKLKIINENLK